MNKKYKIYSWIGLAIALAVFVLVNILMTMLAKKVPIEIDLTSNKRYELSEASYAFLEKYDTDTMIYILASPTNEDKNVRAVLDRYATANDRINIENIDLDENPSFGLGYTEKGEALTANSVIVAASDKSRVIQEESFYTMDANYKTSLNVESEITSALKYVSADNGTHTVYFTTGHNEMSFIGAMEALETENYELWEISLSNTDIPENASLLIIANPATDFTNDEIAKIDKFVRSGGNVQIYVNGNTPTLPNVNAYLEKNGMSVNDNIIVDENALVSGKTFLMNYADNAVTDEVYVKNRYSAYMGFSKWIDYSAVSGAVSVNEYLTSMSGAYTMKSITELENDGVTHYNSPTIALMSENVESGGKVFVCGNTMLLEHGVSEITEAGYDNIVYFTALTNSMCNEDAESFVVPVKSIEDSRLVILESERNIWFTVILAIPVIFIIGGLVIFFRRRNM